LASHVDPICGMTVKEEGAAGEAEYAGRRYYFCSGGCREKFIKDPGRHAPREDRGETQKDAR
jgi:P-type Cu+ transporter